jgi:hypothetical protein
MAMLWIDSVSKSHGCSDTDQLDTFAGGHLNIDIFPMGHLRVVEIANVEAAGA